MPHRLSNIPSLVKFPESHENDNTDSQKDDINLSMEKNSIRLCGWIVAAEMRPHVFAKWEIAYTTPFTCHSTLPNGDMNSAINDDRLPRVLYGRP